MIRTVASIVAAHRVGRRFTEQTVAETFARIRAHDDPAIFITLRDEADAIAEARALTSRDPNLPLFGVPVAVKDNIDVAGLPTTAACPAFCLHARSGRDSGGAAARRRRDRHRQDQPRPVRNRPCRRAFALRHPSQRHQAGPRSRRLELRIGSGGRRPGWCRSRSAPTRPAPGRVPAMLNNIVGLKPSLGLVSTSGVVPACRTLDCVSVFSLTVDDAVATLRSWPAPDDKDAYSRSFPLSHARRLSAAPAARRTAAEPARSSSATSAQRAPTTRRWRALPRWARRWSRSTWSRSIETARLLYEGPWVAERYLTAKPLIEKDPSALHPVILQIVGGGGQLSAADAFKAFYRVQRTEAHRRTHRWHRSTRWWCRPRPRPTRSMSFSPIR